MSDRSKKPTQKGVAKPPPAPPVPRVTEERPTEVDPNPYGRRKSEPIQVVSMKTPHEAPPEPGAPPQTPIVPRPKLRAISEITPLPHAQPRNLGYLAPPRDPAEVRSRRVRDLVVWASVAVMLASVVALAIWFIAR